jgi:phenylalanyl-tRNA synthetase beta chain
MNNGIKPINTTIDKLSYITLLTNIPAAVYDNKEITNIETTSAKDNELFNGLNDKQYTLKNGDIVVKSGNDILSVAGILGSKKHMMSKTTKDIIVEFANFNSPNIRNTSIAQNITTDAAKRFSKQLSNYLIKLSVNLLFEQFQGLPISNVSSKFEDDDVKPIDVDYSFIESILGERINKQMVQDNLTSLGFSFNDDKCFPPPNRLDVLSSQDIAEEIAKFLNINVIMEQSPHIELNNLQNNI